MGPHTLWKIPLFLGMNIMVAGRDTVKLKELLKAILVLDIKFLDRRAYHLCRVYAF